MKYLLLLAFLTENCAAVDRVYYVAALEEAWNYAPSGSTLVSPPLKDDAKVFLETSESRIGSTYKKAIYREYTDDTFSQQVEQPEYLGFLGPVLKGEVGDRIVVHFKNKASRNYTMHPHGVQYEKDSEGAIYIDATNGTDKADDDVAPGSSHTYIWSIRENESPTDEDAACLPWIYHSHVVSEKDTNTGLVGPLLTCKKGTLDRNGKRTDVDKEFFLMFSVLDENLSWYLKDNIENYTNPRFADEDDPDFQESNLMHSINGYMYKNMPVLRMCKGERVMWNIMGLGTEVDMHGVQFIGQTLTQHGHRSEIFNLFPAEAIAASMIPDSVGKYEVECVVYDHHMAGMNAYFYVDQCSRSTEASLTGQVRQHFIAAEEIRWNYGPSGKNLDGSDLTASGSASEKYFERGPHRIGGIYKKAVYKGYTDATFSQKLTRESDEGYLGILGPVIRAEVGDTVKITFKNKATNRYAMRARGMKFDISKEPKGIVPNEMHNYTWTVPESYAPLEADSDCVALKYYSPTTPRDMYSGLMGPMLVCKKGVLDQDGKQKEVDKEFFLILMIHDENSSPYLDFNRFEYCSDASSVDVTNEDFQESNRMHGINGFAFGNLPTIEICNGDKVRWHVMAHGTEADIHTLQFEGNHFSYHGLHRSAIPLFPGSLATLHMLADNNGDWLLFCRNHKHLAAGLEARYKVKQCQGQAAGTPLPARTRTYYIAAQDVEWDYIPVNKVHPRNGVPLVQEPSSRIFVEKEYGMIGSKYMKAVYREYTDDTFTEETARRPEEEHMGILGPYIKAEVGDEVKIVFKNLASREYSLAAPQGARYIYNANRTAVPPNGTQTYHWYIHPTAGPSKEDPSCIVSAYLSDNDIYKDTNTGLVGPLVVCRRGTLDENNKRTDVDREFVLLFAVMDENHSWYLDRNKRKYLDNPNDEDSEEFEESNLMHGINGLIYGNVQGLSMYQRDRVVWYLLGLGEEVDSHTVHFHGTTVTRYTDVSHRSDVIGVFPGTSHVAEMVPHTPGTWLLHCHVNDHITAGMETTYTIKWRPTLPPVSLGSPLRAGIFLIVLALFMGWM